MTSTLATAFDDVLDLRAISPRERHTTIFSRFAALQPGQSLQILNDHNPQPLRYQFEDRCSGQFDWTALESGPTVWHVQITRTANQAAAPAGGSCCSGGACCG
jgi:uncharacterized protein (DUF2249 family)